MSVNHVMSVLTNFVYVQTYDLFYFDFSLLTENSKQTYATTLGDNYAGVKHLLL